MLALRRRRWANISPAFVQCIVFWGTRQAVSLQSPWSPSGVCCWSLSVWNPQTIIMIRDLAGHHSFLVSMRILNNKFNPSPVSCIEDIYTTNVLNDCTMYTASVWVPAVTDKLRGGTDTISIYTVRSNCHQFTKRHVSTCQADAKHRPNVCLMFDARQTLNKH